MQWIRDQPAEERSEELVRLIDVAEGERKMELVAELERLAKTPGRRARSKMFKTRREVR